MPEINYEPKQKTCEYCNKVFTPNFTQEELQAYPKWKRNQKIALWEKKRFCNKSCSATWQRKNNPDKVTPGWMQDKSRFKDGK